MVTLHDLQIVLQDYDDAESLCCVNIEGRFIHCLATLQLQGALLPSVLEDFVAESEWLQFCSAVDSVLAQMNKFKRNMGIYSFGTCCYFIAGCCYWAMLEWSGHSERLAPIDRHHGRTWNMDAWDGVNMLLLFLFWGFVVAYIGCLGVARGSYRASLAGIVTLCKYFSEDHPALRLALAKRYPLPGFSGKSCMCIEVRSSKLEDDGASVATP